MLRSEIAEMLVLDIDKHMHDVSKSYGYEILEIKPDIEQWLESYVGDSWDMYALNEYTYKLLDDTPDDDDSNPMYVIFFGKPEDAFAFKTRWW